MRVKPIVQFGLLAGALALPRAAYPLGLGKLTVDSYAGTAAFRAYRTALRVQGRTRLAVGQGGRPVAVPAEQPAPTRACCRARASRSSAVPATPRSCKVTSATPVERAVSRPAGGGELGGRTGRARLHVPARSSRRRRVGAGRSDHAVRAGTGRPPRLRRAPRLQRPVAHPPRRLPLRRGDRRHLRGQARRYAVQDRHAVQARNGHARPDAGGAVQEQRRTRSRAPT